MGLCTDGRLQHFSERGSNALYSFLATLQHEPFTTSSTCPRQQVCRSGTKVLSSPQHWDVDDNLSRTRPPQQRLTDGSYRSAGGGDRINWKVTFTTNTCEAFSQFTVACHGGSTAGFHNGNLNTNSGDLMRMERDRNLEKRWSSHQKI